MVELNDSIRTYYIPGNQCNGISRKIELDLEKSPYIPATIKLAEHRASDREAVHLLLFTRACSSLDFALSWQSFSLAFCGMCGS